VKASRGPTKEEGNEGSAKKFIEVHAMKRWRLKARPSAFITTLDGNGCLY